MTIGQRPSATNLPKHHTSSTNPRISVDSQSRQLNGSHSSESISVMLGSLRKMKRQSSPAVLPTIKQHNSSLMRPRNRSMKVKQRPPWNNRFCVDSVNNFTSLHPYYKVI